MARFSEGADQYDHVARISQSGVFGPATIILHDRTSIECFIVGMDVGNNARENYAAGKGPVIDKARCTLRYTLDDNEVHEIDALDVADVVKRMP